MTAIDATMTAMPTTRFLYTALLSSLVLLLSLSLSLFSTADAAEFRANYTIVQTAGAGTPRAFSSANLTVTPPWDDGVTTSVPIGFNFTFYGNAYSTVNVADNGNLQFTTEYGSYYPYQLPTIAGNAGPFISAFWTDINSAASVSGGIACETIGTAPNRVFVVRWTRTFFYYTTASTASWFDIELYESTNTIQFHYYQIGGYTDWSYAGLIVVGVANVQHDDYTTDYNVLTGYNGVTLTPTLAAALNQTTITITPSPAIPYVSSAKPPTVDARGTYNATYRTGVSDLGPIPNATSLAGNWIDAVYSIPLGFRFWFYGANFSTVLLNTNGVLQFATQSSTPIAEALPTASSTQVPFIAFAWTNWYPWDDGMITYGTSVVAGSRVLRIRYDNVPHYDYYYSSITVDVLLYESDSSIEVRYASVSTLQTRMTVGIQSAGLIAPGQYDYVSIYNYMPISQLSSDAFTGSAIRFYIVNASIAQSSLPRAPVSFNATLLASVVPRSPLVNATTVEASNDNTDFIPFGFPMRFGAAGVFTGAYLSTNGELQFASSSPIYDASLTFPLDTRAPLLAFFYTDLFPLLNGERSYSTAGSYPNRVFTLRLTDVPYATTATQRDAPTVSIDVLIFEVDYHIEVRYYTVQSSTQLVLVGAQASSIVRVDGTYDLVSLVNRQPASAVASTLNGTTWFITPVNSTRLPNIVLSYGVSHTAPTPAREVLASPQTFTIASYTMYELPLNFQFRFFGLTYSSITVSPFGYAQFNTSYMYNIVPYAWPSGGASYAPMIALYNAYYDLWTPTTTPFSIRYATVGTAPSRRFVLQYTNMPVYSATGVLSADLILYETSNAIEMRFYAVPLSGNTVYTAAVGIIGSTTARSDGTYDMNVVQNADIQSEQNRAALLASAVVFTPGAATTPTTVLPDSYVVSAAPLNSTTPPALTGVTYLSPFDDSSDVVPIGFQFMFYETRYTFVNVSSEGFLQFSAGTPLVSPTSLPVSVATTVPLFAYFWTPSVVPSSSSWMYVTTGAYPNRIFTLRLSNIRYATNTSATVSLDVQLFEYDSRIVVSYYSISQQSTQTVVVGAQGSVAQRYDLTYDYTTFVNNVPLIAPIVNALNGFALTFTATTAVPVPQPVTAFTPTFSGTYNATHTLGVAARLNLTAPIALPVGDDVVSSSIPLGFTFKFFNTDYTSVRVSTNGNLQFETSSTQYYLSALPGGNPSMVPLLAFFSTDLIVTANRAVYQTLGNAPFRTFVLRYTRVTYFAQTATVSLDVILNEFDFAIEVRYYAVEASTSTTPLVIGVDAPTVAGSSTPNYAAVINAVVPDSTVTARLSYTTVKIQRVVYAQTYLPGSYNITRRAGATQVALPTGVLLRTIEGSNDNIDQLPIGFPFLFYGVSYTTVQVSSNGDIQFATSFATYTPRRMPYQTSQASPYLAYFYTDLYPMNDTAKSFASWGQYPNRQFLLRLSNVPYTSTQASSSSPPAVSIDIVFYESNYNIEVRYIRVDASLQTVNVGVEGPNVLRADGATDNSVYLNQVAVGATVVSLLQGSSLVFNYTLPYTRPAFVGGQTYVTSINAVPTLLTLASSTTLTLGDDAVSDSLSIGFTFTFFGTNYTTLRVGSNGNIQFTTQSITTSGSTMPTGNTGVLPAIMFAFLDLYPPGGGSIVYATIGTAPSRSFVLRFTNIGYYSNYPNPGDVSVDVILEETTGTIRLRYYLLRPSTSYMTIGVQASASPRLDGSYDAVIINNYLPITASSGISGNEYVLSLNPSQTGVVVPTPVPVTYVETFATAVTRSATLTSSVSYPWATSAVNGVISLRAGFPVNFFGSLYVVLSIGVNGVITFSSTAPPTVPQAMPYTTATPLPMLAVFFTSSLVPTSIAALTTQLTGSYPSRVFLVRFENLMYSTNTASAGLSADVRFMEQTGAISISYYRVDAAVNQTVLIGLQASTSRRSDYTFDFVSTLNLGSMSSTFSAFLLNRAVTFTPSVAISTPTNYVAPVPAWAGSYNMTMTQSVDTRVTLSAPVTVTFSNADDGYTTVPLGMTFRFYAAEYTSINIGTNGHLQFVTTGTSYIPSAFPSTSTGLSPFIAVFWTDLYADAGTIQYQLLGTPPLRVFVVRYNNLRAFSDTSKTIVADTLLYETNGYIDIRYYAVSAFTTSVQIGIQGTSLTEFGTVWNAAVFGTTGAIQFSYSTVRFRPVSQYASAYASWYNVTSTPNALTSTVPPSLGSTAVTIPGSNDNIDTIAIGFPFRFYNGLYTHASLSSNGDLQFATSSATYVDRRMPSRDSSIVPYLAFFSTDLYPMANTAKSYVRLGTAPNRWLTIRYNAVPYATTFDDSSRAVTIDVTLFEYNASITIRYYRVDASNQSVLIGVESNLPPRADDTIDVTVLYNRVPITTGVAQALQGSIVSFINVNVSGPPPTVPSPAYTLTELETVVPQVDMTGSTALAGTDDGVTTGVPLGFNFTFYGVRYSTVTVSGNGNIQFATSSGSLSPSSFTQGSGGLAPFIAFAFADLYSVGVGTCAYKTFGSSPSRYWVLRYDQVVFYSNRAPLSVDVLLYEATGVIELRYYAMSSSTGFFAVGVAGTSTARIDGSYDAVYVWDAAILNGPAVGMFVHNTYTFTPNTNGTEITLPVSYAVRAVSSVPVRAAAPSTAQFMAVADDYVDYVQPGFSFTFYESVYSLLRVNTNGAIEFTSTVSTYSAAPMPTGNTALLPVFAFFYTNLFPTVSGMISYWTTGAQPNRVLTLRYDRVPYYNTRNNASAPTASFDVLIYEFNSTFEVRYYDIQACPSQSVVIGVQQDTLRRIDYTIDYATYLNGAPLSASVAQSLSNSTVTFTPTTIPSPTTTALFTPLLGASSTSSYIVEHLRTLPSRPAFNGSGTMTLGDDVVTTIPIGFTFNFYGTNYTTTAYSTNGNLQFATASNAYISSAMPQTGSTMLPLLSFFWCDMYPTSTSVIQQYQTLGTAPFRMLVVRVSGSPPLSGVGTLAIDVVLFETTNIVELRYYDVAQPTSNVQIGAQNGVASSTNWWTVWNSVPMSSVGVATLGGTTLRMTPPGSMPVVPSSSVPVVPSSSVPLAPSSAPRPSSSAPLPPSSAPLPPSSAPLPASSVAVPSSTAAPSNADPLGCTPLTFATNANVARVTLVLGSSLATLRARTDASTYVPKILSTVSTAAALSSSATVLSCGSYLDGASSSSTRLNIVVQSFDSATSATTVALKILSLARDTDTFSTYKFTDTTYLSDEVKRVGQLSDGDGVSAGCPLASGVYADCPAASSSSTALSGGAIAGVVIGVLVGVVLILAVFVVLRARSKNTTSNAGNNVFTSGGRTSHAQLEESHAEESRAAATGTAGESDAAVADAGEVELTEV